MTNVPRTKANKTAVMRPKAPPRLKPQGETDGCKRTPVNLGDSYQGRASYDVEAVLSEHLRKGVSFFNVKWQGIPEDGNTWEPIKHLVGDGAEAAIAAFRGKQASDIAAVRPLTRDVAAILPAACPIFFYSYTPRLPSTTNHFRSFLYFISGFGFFLRSCCSDRYIRY